MTDIISRLLDEAEKAQRKGHLLLAEVCRDASDKIGLLTNEIADMTSDYLRRHKDACDRAVEIEQLRAVLRNVHQVLWEARLYLGYSSAGPLNTPFADRAEKQARALLGNEP